MFKDLIICSGSNEGTGIWKSHPQDANAKSCPVSGSLLAFLGIGQAQLAATNCEA